MTANMETVKTVKGQEHPRVGCGPTCRLDIFRSLQAFMSTIGVTGAWPHEDPRREFLLKTWKAGPLVAGCSAQSREGE